MTSTHQRWLLPALIAHSASLRDQLRLSSPEDSASAALYQPGEELNPDLSEFGWAIYYVALRLHLAQLDASESSTSREAVASLRPLLDALTDAPAAVDNLDTLYVYPKSVAATRFTKRSAEQLQRVAAQGDDSLFDAALSIVKTMVWILTSPSPGMPFDEAAGFPAPPPAIRALSKDELDNVLVAHAKLERQRGNFLDSITPGETFSLAELSAELGVSEMSLERERSLLSLLALEVVMLELYAIASRPATGPLAS